MKSWLEDRRAFALLAAAFALIALIVRPWRLDFPLNDGFAYLLSARHFAATGRLRLSDWGAQTQVLQIAWGALWIKIFGWSMGDLKVSTLLWLACGSAFFLKTLQEENVDEAWAVIGVLALVFNPVALAWEMSFMTDIPFLALMLAALWGYARGLRTNRLSWLAAGSAAAAGAFLIRQTGAFLPIAAVLALRRRPRARELAALFLMPLSAVIGYWLWFKFVNGPTWANAHYVWADTLAHVSHPLSFASDCVFRLAVTVEYAGLFAAPLLIGLLAGPAKLFSRERAALSRKAIWAGAGALYAAVILAGVKGSWPYLDGTIQKRGLGTNTVFSYGFKSAGILAWPLFWPCVTLLAAIGGAALCAVLTDRFRNARPVERLFAWAAALQFLAALLCVNYYDRYLLPVVPSALALLCFALSDWGDSKKSGVIALVLLGSFSMAGEMDYANWNAAKWRIGREAQAQGINPASISGGLDWDGWWKYEPAMQRLRKIKPLNKIGEWEWEYQMDIPLLYYFSFQCDNFPTRLKASYFSPLTMGRADLCLKSYNRLPWAASHRWRWRRARRNVPVGALLRAAGRSRTIPPLKTGPVKIKMSRRRES